MHKKGFIFTTDSFISFSLTITALYILLYFLTIPMSYLPTFIQANYLAKDTLYTLESLRLPDSPLTYLDYIVDQLDHGNRYPARMIIGSIVPKQWGYRLERYDPDSDTWEVLYDTSLDVGSDHKKTYDKVRASSETVSVGYSELPLRQRNPYGYMTCNGLQTPCDIPASSYQPGEVDLIHIRLTVYA